MSVPSLSGDQYRLIVESSPVMTWRAGADGACDYFNATWLAFTGRPMEQERGDGWIAGVHPEDRQACVHYYREHFARRAAFEMEYRLRRHDGAYRWIFDRGVPFTDAGRFAGFIGSAVDVDDRRRANQTKDVFLSMIAHGLRTPLTPLRTYVEVVRRHVERGEQVPDETFPRLVRHVDRLARLVDQLTEAVCLGERGGLALRPERLDLSAVIRDAVTSMHETVAMRSHVGGRHGLTYECAVDPMPVFGDHRLLEQLVANLLDNAVKFSPRGGRIRVSTAAADGHWRVAIADEGIGIPREELAGLGRRYYRASNAPVDNYPGLGLGLAICQAIVEEHGGSLAVDSLLGTGTTVTFTIPATQ